MIAVVKVLHVLSLGLWVGAVCFFSFFVALPTIDAMRRLPQTTGNWLGLKTDAEGTRLAGEFLDVVFGKYFPFQFACGVVALLTACWWVSHAGWLPKVRVTLIAVAVILGGCNLWLFAPRVHDLRSQRYSSDQQIARVANEAFNSAHTVSLSADMIGLICVLAALAMTPWLPRDEARQGAAPGGYNNTLPPGNSP